ncbi:MAG: hypothetical protein ACXU89_02700 [Xanthobacteraceae bacterium]
MASHFQEVLFAIADMQRRVGNSLRMSSRTSAIRAAPKAKMKIRLNHDGGVTLRIGDDVRVHAHENGASGKT